ncbi:MAG TPA: response regulator [Candidatus Dormibacteraeota bacterium]
MDPHQAPILVVDGDEAERTVLRRACETAGIAVVEAATGAAAIDLASAGCYSAILVDAALPDIPGVEVCRRVRTGDAVTPILLTGSPAAPGEADRCRAAGADLLVARPYDLPRLLARLHAYR